MGITSLILHGSLQKFNWTQISIITTYMNSNTLMMGYNKKIMKRFKVEFPLMGSKICSKTCAHLNFC